MPVRNVKTYFDNLNNVFGNHKKVFFLTRKKIKVAAY